MKKRFLFIIPCIAIAVASVVGVSQFDSKNLADNDLLMENVEALALDEIKPSKACSTDFKYVNDQIRCPYCHTLSGRQGTLYKCVPGNSLTCMEGFEGTDISCNCQRRPLLPINNVKTFQCN